MLNEKGWLLAMGATAGCTGIGTNQKGRDFVGPYSHRISCGSNDAFFLTLPLCKIGNFLVILSLTEYIPVVNKQNKIFVHLKEYILVIFLIET